MKRRATVIVAAAIVSLTGACAQSSAQQNDDNGKTGIFNDLIPTTKSQNDDSQTAEQIGRFQIVAGGSASVWVLDTATGAVRFCTPVLSSPSDAPACSPWGGAKR